MKHSASFFSASLLVCTILITACDKPAEVRTTTSATAAKTEQKVATQEADQALAASQPAASKPAEESTTVVQTAGKVLASGTISGMNGHHSSGSVYVVESNGDYFVRMGEDFTFDSAPLPIVALGSNGYKKETATEKLKSNSGASEYKLPAGLKIDEYNEVIIWCEKFSVPISKASLTPTE